LKSDPACDERRFSFWPQVGCLHILQDMGAQRASPRKGVGNLLSQLRGHRRGIGYWVAHVVSWLNWRSPTCCCSNEWPGGYSLHLALHVPCRYFCHTRRLRVWLTVSIWQYSCSKMQCTLRPRDSVSCLVLLQQSRRQCTTRQSLDFLCSGNHRSVPSFIVSLF
jgi:hypothetical protein